MRSLYELSRDISGMWRLLLKEKQGISAPSVVATWTSQASSFFTRNNHVLLYVTGKIAHSAGSCRWGMCFLAMGTGGQDCLLHSAPKCSREPASLPCNVMEITSPIFYILSLQIISGLDLSSMPMIRGKMKDHLYFLTVMWVRHWWENTKRNPSPIYTILHCFSLQVGSHFKGMMLSLALSFCAKLSKELVHKHFYFFPQLRSVLLKQIYP